MHLVSSDIAVRDVRRERRVNRLSLLVAWAGGVAAMAATRAPSVLCLAPPAMLLATSWLLGRSHGAAIAAVRVPGERGSIDVDGDALFMKTGSSVRRFALAQIASGWIERFDHGGDDVVLQMKSGELLRVTVDSADDGRALIQAAGVSPEKRSLTLRLGVEEPSGSRVLMIFLALVVGSLSLPMMIVAVAVLFSKSVPGMSAAMVIPAVLTIVAFNILLRPLITSTIRVGTDGIEVRRLFRRWFIPRAAFTGTTGGDGRLHILAGDKTLRLPVSGVGEATVVADRIREAMAEQRAGAESVASKLDRQGREVGAWLREVRALARAATSYRDATLDQDELEAVVNDGAAAPERRVAAAAALASDADGRRRARIASEACVDDDLRAAIEQAAEEEIDEASLGEALQRLRRLG